MSTSSAYHNVDAVHEPYTSTPGDYYTLVASGPYETSLPPTEHYPMAYSGAYLTPQTASMENYEPKFEQAEPLHDYMRQNQLATGLNISGLPVHSLSSHEDISSARPRSSPSTFNPNSNEVLVWTGVPNQTPDVCSYPGSSEQSFMPAFSPVAPPSASRHRPSSSAPSATEPRVPSQRRSYPPIAPNPSGTTPLRATKRTFDDEDFMNPKRRRESSPSPSSPELSEDDRLLLRLKDEETLPWKDISNRFQTDLGKTMQVPALQMRLKRLRERMRIWTDADVSALRMAHEYWERSKFEIISAKMVDFGATEKWSPRQCARKWQDSSIGTDVYANHIIHTPAFSYTSSPIDDTSAISSTPSHFPYLSVPISS
ncbi:hypothetical protein LTS18_011508 [Coniosporium uncinatum]|uniref:Uncharacterized protein n=1 Tax=Coniosporium uncinatum TaxID=93489 RepID=A0ACC3DW99_9PEZI|nr:hypothetical protein LTS18_011508 [Coniosporium uncinatum]